MDECLLYTKTSAVMPRLLIKERERVVGIIRHDSPHNHVARIFNCTRLIKTRLMKRYRQISRAASSTKTSRIRVTTPAEDQHLRLLHLRNLFLTVTSSVAWVLGHGVSRRNVSRRQRNHGNRAYGPYDGLVLTPDIRRSTSTSTANVGQYNATMAAETMKQCLV